MAKASARHILVDSEEKCNDLKQKIADGANFADVAREHSSCPSSAPRSATAPAREPNGITLGILPVR